MSSDVSMQAMTRNVPPHTPQCTEKQAETLAAEHVALLNANLATKADLAAVKADLLKWLIGALIAQASLIVALVKFL